MGDVKKIVLPGDPIDVQGKMRNGVYRGQDNRYYSEYFGTLQVNDQFVDVVPFSGQYIPRKGDKVIGKVIEVGPSTWTVDINSPYFAMLHMNDTPWRMSSGDLKRYLNAGDYVYAKIMSVNEIKESWLTLKEPGLKKLEGGHMVLIHASRVPRVIGKGGGMVNMVKELTATRIIIGQNGLIWIDGPIEGVTMAIAAIEMIEREAHTEGLTARVESFLKELKGEKDGSQQNKADQ